MQKRKSTFLKYFYAITGLVWFFFGMARFQNLSRRYDPFATEHWNIANWLPALATMALLAGWLGASLMFLARTQRARLLLSMVAMSSWILLMVSIAVSFGIDTSAILQSPGVDLVSGLSPFIFAAHHLGASRLLDDMTGEKTS